MANKRYGFIRGDIVNRELSSEIAFNAFNISITTKTLRDKVLAFTFPAVKYWHGFLTKSKPSMKLAGANSAAGQAGQSPQCES